MIVAQAAGQTKVQCSTISTSTNACDATPWCMKVSAGSGFACVTNTTCGSIALPADCNAVPSCAFNTIPGTNGPQCDGWDGSTYSTNSQCFYGQFSAASQSGTQTSSVGSGNTCLASAASGFMGNLWDIQGVSPGSTRISDGGNDMYVRSLRSPPALFHTPFVTAALGAP